MFSDKTTRSVLLIVLSYQQVSSNPRECDTSVQSNLKEGNLGETNAFPWLGVLRVHIHEGQTFKIALTGLVLIKRRYGIVNADDIARVNPTKIRREGKAMFIVNDNETLSCAVQEYTLHPEYEYATYNTIALVQLADENNGQLKPICWPDYNHKTFNQLYVLGFTDEKMYLEKIMYKIEYIASDLCDEFYNRVGFTSNLYNPVHYHCGLAANNKKNCMWDNGMVLASNSTGRWIIVGFGVRGPGCAAPSRFINISPYIDWIVSSTDQ